MNEDTRIVSLENEIARLRRELMEQRLGLGSESTGLVRRLLRDQSVLESLPDVITVLDRQFRMLYINRVALPGLSNDDLLGRSALEFIPREHAQHYCELFEHCWETGLPVGIEVPTIGDFWWEARLVPVRVAGEVAFVLASSADITQRKHAERALRESESRLRLALDAGGMGTWSWDERNDACVWDANACQIFGVEAPSEVSSLADYLALIHEDDRERVANVVASRACSGANHDLEFRVVGRDGEIRHVHSKGTVIRDDAGAAIGCRGIVFDVSARKRLEEQLSEGQKMEAIGQLTAGIAHNFNNLLSVILPNVGLARRSSGAQLEARLADIEHAARRAAAMVQQLVLFARRSPSVQGRERLELGAAVARTLQICRTTFDRAIRIELVVEDGVPAVAANPGQIEQVLLNICINARDALEQARRTDPTIEVRVERSAQGGARVRVFDNGPGMDEQTRRRVFEPFFTTKEVGRGSGLGLATAYAIVSEHQGRITCRSQPGVGTVFEFELLADERSELAPAPAPLVAAAPVGSETVLLIDDEPLVRRAAAAMLAEGGYRVIEADGGRDGLDAFARARAQIALVILDRSMPGMPGEQVAQRLHELDPQVPIVLLSGYPGPAPAAAHAAALLSKPVDAQTLLSTIRDAIDRRRA
jgi:two-component system, cell cycle sensor histidine kinase and response regulator CckA